MEHMGVYLTNSNNQTIELPVAPSDFQIPGELDGDSTTILGLGEIETVGFDKLKTLEIESTLPVSPAQAPWCTAQKLLNSAQDYINWIESARTGKKPVRVVLSGTQFNLSALVMSFKYGFTDGNSDEYAYTLDFTQYKEVKAQLTVIKQIVPKKPAPKPAPPKKIGIGSTVIVNGTLHRDSYGTGPGLTEHNATRKINFTAPGRACPYHVTLLNGGWRGWVTAGSVRAV